MSATLTCLGHSAFLITAGEHRVLIDPFLTGNTLAEKAGIKPDDFDPTHILLTHGHDDHTGDAPAIAKRTGCQVTANFEVCQWFATKHNHDNINPGNPGGRGSVSSSMFLSNPSRSERNGSRRPAGS